MSVPGDVIRQLMSGAGSLNNGGDLSGVLNNPALLQKLLGTMYGSGSAPGPGGLATHFQNAPGASTNLPGTQFGLPIPRQPGAIGQYGNLAMQIGRGTLNQWPPSGAQSPLSTAGGMGQIPWLKQQHQMLMSAPPPAPSMAPPWMSGGPMNFPPGMMR